MAQRKLTLTVPNSSLQPSKKDWTSFWLRLAAKTAALLCALVLLGVLGYVLAAGLPYLKPSLFEWTYTTQNHSMMPAILNTLIMVFLTLLIAVPLGVGSAVYLNEYAKKGSLYVKAILMAAQTLSGVPSIVFGLFGMLLFVNACGFSLSLLSGALTMAVMVLPTILQTSRQALASLPDSYREGSYGLGAGKRRTIFTILLPAAMDQIVCGVVLATGRILAETAALIYTAGTLAKAAFNVMEPGSTLAVHMYKLMSEGLFMDQAGAVAVVLVVMAALMNLLSYRLERAVGKNRKGL